MEQKKGFFNKFLDGVEKVGNKLPHPITLFLILSVAVIVISEICVRAGVEVTYTGMNMKTKKIEDITLHAESLLSAEGIRYIFNTMTKNFTGFAPLGTVLVMKTKKIEDITLHAESLLSAEGIRYIFNTMTKNFTGFAPLGTVLVAMLGVGVAEGTGLINASLRKLVLSTPPRLLTAVMVFAGVMSNIASDAGYVVMSNIASDAGYVVLIPLGAIIFASVGRHPLAGLAAAFSGVSGGFSANLLLGTIDPLLGGISTEAARIFVPDYTVLPTANWYAAFSGVSGGFSANLLLGTIDPLLGGISTEAARIFVPDYTVLPTANWYFMIVSTFLITILGTIVTEKIVEPRLGEYKGDYKEELTEMGDLEKRGLRNAGIALLVFLGIIAYLTVPSNAIFREGGNLNKFMHDGLLPVIMLFFMVPGYAYGKTVGTIKSDKDVANAIFREGGNLNKFMHDGLLPVIMLFFMVPGYAYGKTVGTIKSDKDVAKLMGNSLGTMGGYMALAFVASQFIVYFSYTKLGTIIAVKGADFLQSIGFTGFPLIVAFILVAAFINLFMGSASAKWAILAPVFIPMFMRLGYSPELTQAMYRIGDSSTNIISPLMSYFAFIVAYMSKFDKESGMGTLISTMLPYSITFLSGWTVLLMIFYFFGLPIGPGAMMHFAM